MRTYGKIRREASAKRWVIDALEPHVAIKLKAIFKEISKTKTPPLYFKDTPENCRELEWFLQRYQFEMTDYDRAQLQHGKEKHIQTIEDSEAILKPDYTPREFKFKGVPRHYQSVAAELFLNKKRLVLGDDVGLGKTISAILGLADHGTLPALVVVQTHLPKQWKDQIEKFTDQKVHLIKGTTPYTLPPADVYVMKYSCLAGWSDVYGMGIFKTVIFDECQELRKTGSQKYEAAKHLSNSVEYAAGLTATPVYNYGNEIYNIFDLIIPGSMGDYNDFYREWCGYSGAITDPKALGTYLREHHYFLRRTREEVGRELPPVNKIIHTVGYDESAIADIETIAKTLAVRTTQGSFIERGKAARELDILVRQATGVSKAKYVAEYVSLLLENNEPVLLAGWHRDVYSIWLKELERFNPVMYTGSESPAQKEQAKQDFISGKTNLMIISLRSGIGLDGLQARGSVVVFGELDWSPAVHGQVTGRLDRDGQANQVTAIYLISDSGSDPLIVDMLGLKASQADGIINPFGSSATQHSDESRMQKLAQIFLDKKIKADPEDNKAPPLTTP